MTSVARIITTPRTTTTRSSATPARCDRKMPIAKAAEIEPPMRGSRPNIASVPMPEPATLPMLKMKPPRTTSPASR